MNTNQLLVIDKNTKLTSTGTGSNHSTKKCHEGPVEIYPNLWIGSSKEGNSLPREQDVDVLIPLDSTDGAIWDCGWRGELRYIPIKDFGVLPKDIIKEATERVVEDLQDGLKVGIYCIGGHGRTGYFTAIVLGLLSSKGLLDIEDPIAYLREHYCEEAVETRTQINAVAEILDKPELKKHQPSKTWSWGGDYGYGYGSYDSYDDYYSVKYTKTKDTCYDCAYYYPDKWCKGYGECVLSQETVSERKEACKDFDDYYDYYKNKHQKEEEQKKEEEHEKEVDDIDKEDIDIGDSEDGEENYDITDEKYKKALDKFYEELEGQDCPTIN